MSCASCASCASAVKAFAKQRQTEQSRATNTTHQTRLEHFVKLAKAFNHNACDRDRRRIRSVLLQDHRQQKHMTPTTPSSTTKTHNANNANTDNKNAQRQQRQQRRPTALQTFGLANNKASRAQTGHDNYEQYKHADNDADNRARLHWFKRLLLHGNNNNQNNNIYKKTINFYIKNSLSFFFFKNGVFTCHATTNRQSTRHRAPVARRRATAACTC